MSALAETDRATWSTAFVNNLPDSSFLHIQPGGKKDGEGKTVPRSLRMFPYKDASGSIDLPHLRNALARIPQSNLPQSLKDSLTAKAQRLLNGAEGQSSQRPPRDELVRSAPTAFEVRGESPHEPPRLIGHFARFNEWTEIDSTFEGNFLERIAPGAFKKTMAENARMRVLFQHGMDPQIGDKPLGAIDVLREDDEGAYYEVRLLEAPYVREILPGLRAGLYGSSFRFAVQREEFDRNAKASEYNPKGLPERTLKEVAVREFGPVTFPAYEGATAGVRSLTDEFLLKKLEPERAVYSPPQFAQRVDAEDLSCLGQMLELGACYIEEQDEPGDEANIPKMEAILASIAALVPYEAQEDEGSESEDEMASGEPRHAVAPPDAGQGPPRDAARAATPKTWPPTPPDVWEELWNPGI